LGLAGACDALGVVAGGGGPCAAVRGTNEKLVARKNAPANIPRCKSVRFHKNLLGTIANAASPIRPRVYYDHIGVRRSWVVTLVDLTEDGRQRHATILSMKPTSKRLGKSAIAWSLAWALAIIATAFLFRGNPVEYWIEASLIIGALTFVVLKRRDLSASAR
jgi:hypothetical protein